MSAISGVSAVSRKPAGARTYANMVLFLVPFFRPSIINDWAAAEPIKQLFSLWLAAACIYAIVRFVSRNGRIGLFLAGLMGFLALAAISTLINSGSQYLMLVNTLILISPCLFIPSLRKDEVLAFVRSAALIIGFIVLCNQLLTILLPDGIYYYNGRSRWLLENGSLQSRWCFLLLFFAAFWDILAKRRLSILTLFAAILSFWTVWMLGSATSMVALILDVAILALGGKRIIGKMLNCRAINVITVFLFVGIVLLRVADYLPYNDIAVFLGKDLTYHSGSTFTGRTYIWDAVIASIRESPLIGYGWQEYVAMGIAHFYGQQDFNSAHNLLLQIVFVGGFVGFALFLMAYLQSSKFVDALRSKSLRCLFVSAFAAFLLTSLFEQVLTSAFLILLSMAVSPVLRELDLEISTIEQDGTVGENPASSSMDARHLV